MIGESSIRSLGRVLAVVLVLAGAWWAFAILDGTRWTDQFGKYHSEPASLGNLIAPALLLVSGLLAYRVTSKERASG